ncbi:MAG: AtpZ/AtpI family protein [Bacteroidales bacterium]|nr:AtpZ/AtpI family protein [Bacteroidales bacterium]
MSDDKNKKSPLRSYAEYSGLGLEMVAIVLVCTLIGYYLDKWVPIKFPLFTLFFVAVGLTGSIVVLIKRTKK